MAGGGHDHGGGHGGGGGGGHGPGLGLDLAAGGTPMGFLQIAGVGLALAACAMAIASGWLWLVENITWTGLTIPILLVVALFLAPRLTIKMVTTAFCLVIAVLFMWLAYTLGHHMYITIDEPFAIRHGGAGEYLALMVSLAFLLFVVAVPTIIAITSTLFAWWLWWGKTPSGHGH